MSILEIFQMDAKPRPGRFCGPNATGVVGGEALVWFSGAADVKGAIGLALQNIDKISHHKSVFRVQVGLKPTKRDHVLPAAAGMHVARPAQ